MELAGGGTNGKGERMNNVNGACRKWQRRRDKLCEWSLKGMEKERN
jgi:hypothetical protein